MLGKGQVHRAAEEAANWTFPSKRVTGSEGSCEPRKGTRAVPPAQFSRSSFRGSVSSSASSFTFPFFLPFPFPLPPLVVAVGGFFSFSVALLSVGGARLPRAAVQAGRVGKVKASPCPRTSAPLCMHMCTHTHTSRYTGAHTCMHRYTGTHTGASMSTQTDMHTGNLQAHILVSTCTRIHLAVTGQVVWWLKA